MLYVAVTRIGYISRAESAIDNQLNRFESSTETISRDRRIANCSSLSPLNPADTFIPTAIPAGVLYYTYQGIL
jgi:hypothetical protein